MLLNAYYYPCPRWTGALLFTATQLVQKSLPVYLFTSKLFKILKSYFHKPYTITTKTRLSSLYIYIVYRMFLYDTRSYLHKKSLVSGLGAMCFINNDILLWLLWRSAPLHFRDAETSGSTYGYLNTFPSLNGYSPFYII